VPELPRDVLLDMQRSVGNRAVSAVVGGEAPPPAVRTVRVAGDPVPDLPLEARRPADPPGTWVAPWGLGTATDCGSALELGVKLRSRLTDAALRRELTALLRDLADDPQRALPRSQALRLAGLGERAMRQRRA
jgi:hypothetical protein